MLFLTPHMSNFLQVKSYNLQSQWIQLRQSWLYLQLNHWHEFVSKYKGNVKVILWQFLPLCLELTFITMMEGAQIQINTYLIRILLYSISSYKSSGVVLLVLLDVFLHLIHLFLEVRRHLFVDIRQQSGKVRASSVSLLPETHSVPARWPEKERFRTSCLKSYHFTKKLC